MNLAYFKNKRQLYRLKPVSNSGNFNFNINYRKICKNVIEYLENIINVFYERPFVEHLDISKIECESGLSPLIHHYHYGHFILKLITDGTRSAPLII